MGRAHRRNKKKIEGKTIMTTKDDALKPLDLSNLLRHALMSGANGVAWVDYNPDGFHAYQRIKAILENTRAAAPDVDVPGLDEAIDHGFEDAVLSDVDDIMLSRLAKAARLYALSRKPAAPSVAVGDAKKLNIWDYCPECGNKDCEVLTSYDNGTKEMGCRPCCQCWFTDVDYSKAVQINLSRKHAALQPDTKAQIVKAVEGIERRGKPYYYDDYDEGYNAALDDVLTKIGSL
jgi:hypothetical protein